MSRVAGDRERREDVPALDDPLDQTASRDLYEIEARFLRARRLRATRLGPDIQAVPGELVPTFRRLQTVAVEPKLAGVSGDVFERTPDLNRMRELLFADLSPEEGWAEIQRAMLGSLVEAHWRRLEETLGGRHPIADLRGTEPVRAGQESSET